MNQLKREKICSILGKINPSVASNACAVIGWGDAGTPTEPPSKHHSKDQRKMLEFLCHSNLRGLRRLVLTMILASGVLLPAFAAPTSVSTPDAFVPLAASTAQLEQRYYAVQRGQSLHDVVVEIAHAGAANTPEERALLKAALLQANPRAFIAGNPDRLKKEAILIVPADFIRTHSALLTAPTLKMSPLPASAEQEQVQPQTQSVDPVSVEQSQVQTQIADLSTVAQVQPQLQPQATEPSVMERTVSTIRTSSASAVASVSSLASFSSKKILDVFATRYPQFASRSPAFLLLGLGIILVALVLLSLYLHRCMRARASRQHKQQSPQLIAPVLTNATELPQEPQEIDELVNQVTTWFKQHPTPLPPLPSAGPDNPSAENIDSLNPAATASRAEAEFKSEAEVEPDYAPQPLVDAAPIVTFEAAAFAELPPITFPVEDDLSAAAASNTAPPSALAISTEAEQETIKAELEKLEMASQSINLGDISKAHALIDEVTELVEASLIEEQTKHTEQVRPDTEDKEEIAEAEQTAELQPFSSTQAIASDTSEAEPLEEAATLDANLLLVDTEPTLSPEAEERLRIEHNKLELVSAYLDLGDLKGARLLAQEVAASAAAELRAKAEQMLAKIPDA